MGAGGRRPSSDRKKIKARRARAGTMYPELRVESRCNHPSRSRDARLCRLPSQSRKKSYARDDVCGGERPHGNDRPGNVDAGKVLLRRICGVPCPYKCKTYSKGTHLKGGRYKFKTVRRRRCGRRLSRNCVLRGGLVWRRGTTECGNNAKACFTRAAPRATFCFRNRRPDSARRKGT